MSHKEDCLTTPTHDHDETIVVRHDQAAATNAAQVRVSRFAWSPAQWVAAFIGLFLVVMGAVALLRVGLDNLVGDTATVVTFEHTALMGIIDVIIGLFFLGAAGSALANRSGLITLWNVVYRFWADRPRLNPRRWQGQSAGTGSGLVLRDHRSGQRDHRIRLTDRKRQTIGHDRGR